MGISEGILKKETPFNEMKAYKEFTSIFFRKYLEYENELEDTFKEKVLKREIDYSKFLFHQKYIEPNADFYGLFPENRKVENDFAKWVNEKEGNVQRPIKQVHHNYIHEKIEFVKIIKEIINKKENDYSYVRKKEFPGLFGISLKKIQNNEIFLLIDT